MKRHIRYDEEGEECKEFEVVEEDRYEDENNDVEVDEEEDERTDIQLPALVLDEIKAELNKIGYAAHVRKFFNCSKDDRELQSNQNLVSKLISYLFINRHHLTKKAAKYSVFDATIMLKWFYLACRNKPSLISDFFTSLKSLGARPNSCKKYLIFLGSFTE